MEGWGIAIVATLAGIVFLALARRVILPPVVQFVAIGVLIGVGTVFAVTVVLVLMCVVGAPAAGAPVELAGQQMAIGWFALVFGVPCGVIGGEICGLLVWSRRRRKERTPKSSLTNDNSTS